MALPVKVTDAETSPAVAVPIVGACGTVVAVIDAEAEDAGPVAVEFVEATVNVYEVALCNPVTVKGDDAPEAVKPPGDEVAVNEDAGPPVVAAVNETVAAPLLYALDVPTFVALLTVGASGTSFRRALSSPDTDSPFALRTLIAHVLYTQHLRF